MKKYSFPKRYISELPNEVKTYLLLAITNNIERQLNKNIGKGYGEMDIHAGFMAEILGAQKLDDEATEENDEE